MLAGLDAHFEAITAWLKDAGAEKVWISAESLPSVVIMANFPALKDAEDRSTPRQRGGRHKS